MDVSIMETMSLIFIATKVIDGARLIQKFNVIVLTLIQSTKLLGIFACILTLFNLSIVPLA